MNADKLSSKARQVVGFINTTLKGNRIVFGGTTEDKAHAIIKAILIGVDLKVSIEVKAYCSEHYNY